MKKQPLFLPQIKNEKYQFNSNKSAISENQCSWTSVTYFQTFLKYKLLMSNQYIMEITVILFTIHVELMY